MRRRERTRRAEAARRVGAAVAALALVAAPERALPGPEDEPPASEPRVRIWRESGQPDRCVDVVFVGDGYTRKQLAATGKLWKDVGRYAKRLLEERPFSSYEDRFNVRAVLLESKDEGCDLSPDSEKVATALQSHFDSPNGRLLAFRDGAALERAVRAAGQTDIVFVMVNTEKYGGAGTVLHSLQVRGRPLPAPTFSAQDTASFLIAVHELGHSFANLADEYVNDGDAPHFPLPKDGADLAQDNVTLAGKFDAASFATLQTTLKWRKFLELPGAKKRPWVHEGAFYRATGVFRPWHECKMRENAAPFCPVCCAEVARSIHAASGTLFDEAAHHKAHPLDSWR